MKFSSLFLATLFAAPFVSAHGVLRRITIQGKVFEGNLPGRTGKDSVIRLVDRQDPNYGAQNLALTCGHNSAEAALFADAKPGDTITFAWKTASDGNWPHDTGPMLTYMASCGRVTCDQFDQSEAKWFKINQVGRKSGGEWAQKDLMGGGVDSVRIPEKLAPGNYLIRHEIIALHLATEIRKAEFYPGCAQLKISGNEKGVPKDSDLVSLPGAYSDNDPGIFDPSVFDPKATYTFPGPPVANLEDGSSTSLSPLPSSTASFPTGTPRPSPPKSCKKKPAPSNSPGVDPSITLAARPEVGGNTPRPTPTPTPTPGTGYSDYRPRRLGHIMRRMAFENTFH